MGADQGDKSIICLLTNIMHIICIIARFRLVCSRIAPVLLFYYDGHLLEVHSCQPWKLTMILTIVIMIITFIITMYIITIIAVMSMIAIMYVIAIMLIIAYSFS